MIQPLAGGIELVIRYERAMDAHAKAVISGGPSDRFEAGRAAKYRGLYRFAAQLFEAADTADGSAQYELALLLANKGDHAQAENLLRAAAEAGNTVAGSKLEELLERDGRPADAVRFWRVKADAGDRSAALKLADLLPRTRAFGEAEQWLRKLVAAGNQAPPRHTDLVWTDAMYLLTVVLELTGRREEATPPLRRAAALGNSYAKDRLADLLDVLGRHDEADRLRRCGIDPGGETAQPW